MNDILLNLKQKLQEYINQQKVKVVEVINFNNNTIQYSNEIKQYRKIVKLSGTEEIVRAYLLTKLVNEFGYKPENIEVEKNYDIGRPKLNKPRIDVIVRDQNGDAFLYIELKAPNEFEKNQDEVIEKQLFNLASQEKGQGKKVKYLVLYSIDTDGNEIKDRVILIDYEKFSSFDAWKEKRDFVDKIPTHYGKAQKEPYVKGGSKDLENNFSHEKLNNLRKNLHNVLWGGGGTNDNDIFSSLVNIILAKIQDETEKEEGQKYDFQIFESKDGESFETNEELFNRINELYKRALIEKLGFKEEEVKNERVVNRNRFSLNKLRFVVSQLEGLSFWEGRNSLSEKDILGEFFEGIIRDGFKQSKGQFFTHVNIVRFILWGLQLDRLAISKINNERRLPYIIDPSAGSGTFLIEYMKFITENIKRRFRDKIKKSHNVGEKMQEWFYPDNQENKWAKKFIYGSEINPDLGTATKVNMILHGDGSANIFVKDGLWPFRFYDNLLSVSNPSKVYKEKEVNEQFDVIITNPPFSVDLDSETKKRVQQEFLFGNKKNSENLFIERFYQLLKPKGRLGVVLPESVFDTTENKYIRLFIYKYFNIKAVVSLPQLTFEPYTSTKTSLLFAQKKTNEEVEKWDKLWQKYASEFGDLRTRVENFVKVYLEGKDRNKLPSIKDLTQTEEKEILKRYLKNYWEEDDERLSVKEILEKYRNEIKDLGKFDKDLLGTLITEYRENTWWVFGEVAKELNYKIFMAEVENVGYKRTKRGEKPMPNELYRTGENGKILVDDGVKETALDYLREVEWEE